LGRNEQECLHRLKGAAVRRLFPLVGADPALVEISQEGRQLRLCSLNCRLSPRQWEGIAAYIREWFDLGADLRPFYEMAERDEILSIIYPRFAGLRLVGLPDLFEAFSWAIIGQQINLDFAYRLKRRWVEACGQRIEYEGDTYFLHPAPAASLALPEQEMRRMQFSRQKIGYLREVAGLLAEGSLSKTALLTESAENVEQLLLQIKGVGPWTAHYVMMKCLRIPTAIPLQDAGLQQALKRQLGLEQKLQPEMLREITRKWHPYQAYATFYLWQSLLDTV